WRILAPWPRQRHAPAPGEPGPHPPRRPRGGRTSHGWRRWRPGPHLTGVRRHVTRAPVPHGTCTSLAAPSTSSVGDTRAWRATGALGASRGRGTTGCRSGARATERRPLGGWWGTVRASRGRRAERRRRMADLRTIDRDPTAVLLMDDQSD